MALKIKKTTRPSAALEEAMVELKKEETQMLSVFIPKSILKAFKIKAAEEETTMTKVILKYVNQYISKGVKEEVK